VLDDLSRLSATGVQYPLALELRNGELAIRVKTNQPEHLHALIEGNGALETVSKPSSPIPQQPAAQARLIRELIQSLAVSGLTNAGIIELKRSMLHLEELQFNGKIDHTILQDAMLASRHALKRSGKISSDTSDIAAFLGSIDIECALAAPRILGAQPSEQSIERLRNNLLLLRANGLSHVPLESVNKVNLNKLWSEGQTRFLNQSVVLDPQFTRYVLTNVPLNSFAPLPEEISYIAHSDETLLIDMTWNLTRGALGPRLNSIYLGEHTKPADIANALSLYHQSVFDNFTRLMNEQPELMLPVINQFRQSPTVPTFRPGDRVNSSFSGFPDDANTLWVTDGTPILNKDDLGHHRASIEHGSFTLLVVRHPLSEMARVIRGDQHVQTTPTSKHVVSSGPIYEALGQILSTNYLKSKEILAVVQGEQQHG
jgi:hypothetical protein